MNVLAITVRGQLGVLHLDVERIERVVDVLIAVVFVFYYAMTGEQLPNWPALVLLALVMIAASYALVTKTTAAALERKLSPAA